MQTLPSVGLINALPQQVQTVCGSLKSPIDCVVILEGNSNYTTFHLKDGRKIMVARTLGYFENQLLLHGFIRVHKSFMVNLNHIVSAKNSHFSNISNGQTLEVARRRRSEVKKACLTCWRK